MCTAYCLLCVSGSIIPMVQPWLRMALRGRVERKLLQLQIRFQWRLCSNYLKICSLSDSYTKWAPLYYKGHEVKLSVISSLADATYHRSLIWSVRSKNEALFPWWVNATWCLAECSSSWRAPPVQTLGVTMEVTPPCRVSATHLVRGFTLWGWKQKPGHSQSHPAAFVLVRISSSSLRAQKGECQLTLIVQCSKMYTR